MIRTVQQWLESNEYQALRQGGTLAAFIEAVQRDVVEACSRACEIRQSYDDERRIEATWCARDIRAIIPPKPKETA